MKFGVLTLTEHGINGQTKTELRRSSKRWSMQFSSIDHPMWLSEVTFQLSSVREVTIGYINC